MKRISVREISEIMSKKEMMRVFGGSDTGSGSDIGSGSDYVNIFSSCISRSTCSGECYHGVYHGSCGKYFPSLNSLDWICACIIT